MALSECCWPERANASGVFLAPAPTSSDSRDRATPQNAKSNGSESATSMKKEILTMDEARRTRVRALVASARSQAVGSGVHIDNGSHTGKEPIPLLLPGYEI